MAYGNGGYETTSVRHMDMDAAQIAPKRSPMIQVEIGGAEKRVEDLHSVISALEARLSNVTQSEPPTAVSNKSSEPAYPGVPMVAALTMLNARIASAAGRLQSLLERLEV